MTLFPEPSSSIIGGIGLALLGMFTGGAAEALSDKITGVEKPGTTGTSDGQGDGSGVEGTQTVTQFEAVDTSLALSNSSDGIQPINRKQQLNVSDQLSQPINNNDVQLIVLARYMQVLSEEFTNNYKGKIINIHHSFLPSFKGARPYHQAFERGVKVIGATAHYVTKDLDEGPIIEQDTQEVNHEMMPSDLVLMGRDIEARVLYRAIKAHSERRVFLNDNRTIVFRGQRI